MGDLWFRHATNEFAWNGFVDDPFGVLCEPLESPPGSIDTVEVLPEADKPWLSRRSSLEYRREVAWWSQETRAVFRSTKFTPLKPPRG